MLSDLQDDEDSEMEVAILPRDADINPLGPCAAETTAFHLKEVEGFDSFLYKVIERRTERSGLWCKEKVQIFKLLQTRLLEAGEHTLSGENPH